jgi:hypothetical protein
MKFKDFFVNHPEKILGIQIDTTDQWGKPVKVVKGNLTELSKIDVSPSLEPQIRETAEFVDLAAMSNIQKSLAKTLLERESKKETLSDSSKSNVYLQPVQGQHLFTEDEAFEFLNEGIDENDIEVWVYYCIDNNRPIHPYLIKRFQKPYTNEWFKKQLENGFLCFDFLIQKYVPRVIFYSGNIAEKISLLKNSDGNTESIFGDIQKQRQIEKLQEIEPEKLKLSGELSNRLILDPLSKFCKEFKLSNGETIFQEFEQFIDTVSEEDKLTDIREWTLKHYFLHNNRLSSNYSKEEKEELKIKASKEIPHLMTLFTDQLPDEDKAKIEYLWNLENNAFVDPNYNQVPLMFVISKTFKNKPISIRPEQREGVAFNEINGTGVLGFDVGVGKTLTAILTIAQFMQSGRCKRPIIVVPKPTFWKWIGEIRGIFNESKELEGTGILPEIKINAFYNFGKDVMKNQDIVVEENTLSMVTYQGVKRMGFSDDYSMEFKQQLVDIMEQVGDITERARQLHRKQSDSLISEGKFNAEVLMDELGFDYMCMDEAHNANKIFMNVKGEVNEDTGNRAKSRFSFSGGGQPSMLGKKMFFLSQFVQKNSNGLGNVQLLTATPFTNNPLNVYNIFALTNYSRLQSYGIGNVNTFFEKYVEVTYDKVVNSRGDYEEKEVIKSWKNKVALQKILFGIINYKGAKDSPSIKRPNKIVLPLLSEIIDGKPVPLPSDKQIITILAPTDRQRANKTAISEWLTVALKDEEMSKKAPYLVADSMASKNTLSPLIYEEINPESLDPKHFIESSPKLNTMMKVIKGINDWFDERKAPRSCQIIYSAQGIQYFGLIKQYLMENLGYKSKVHEYEKNKYFDEVEILAGSQVDDDLKEEIKSAFNNGKIKILIGSSTIREGIDLQTRTSTLHNLWPDWNPTDAKQLEGRLWRFGNMFDYVRIISYLVQGGSDMFKYQKLQEKTARINDIFDRLNKENILDVSDEDREAVKWALVDDINVIVKDEIKSIEKDYLKKIKILESRIENFESFETDLRQLNEYKKQIENYAFLMRSNNEILNLDFTGKDDLAITKMIINNFSKINNSAINYSAKSELTSWRVNNSLKEQKRLSNKIERIDDFTKKTKNVSIFDVNIPEEILILKSQIEEVKLEIENIKSESFYNDFYQKIEKKRNEEISLSTTPEVVAKRILSLNDVCLKIISVDEDLTKPNPSVKPKKEKSSAVKDVKTAEKTILPKGFEDLDEEVKIEDILNDPLLDNFDEPKEEKIQYKNWTITKKENNTYEVRNPNGHIQYETNNKGTVKECKDWIDKFDKFSFPEHISQPTTIPLKEIVGKGFDPSISIKFIDKKHTDNPIWFSQSNLFNLTANAKVKAFGKEPSEYNIKLYELVKNAIDKGYQYVNKKAGKYQGIYILIKDYNVVYNTGEVLTKSGIEQIFSQKTQTQKSSSNIDEAIDSLKLSLEFLPEEDKKTIQYAISSLEIAKEFL